MADAARQRNHAVMAQHIAVQGINRGIINIRREDSLAQVIQHHHPRGAAQPAEGLLMQLGPHLRTGAEHQQAHALAAVAQSQYE